MMTSKELLKIINSLTDEERRLSLEKIEEDLESIIKALKKTDYSKHFVLDGKLEIEDDKRTK